MQVACSHASIHVGGVLKRSHFLLVLDFIFLALGLLITNLLLRIGKGNT